MSDSNSLPTSHVDVLVVGAGPAGLLCGVALAQAGINVKIVDQRYVVHLPYHLIKCIDHDTQKGPVHRRPISIPAGQADGIHPRTIEVLQVNKHMMKKLIDN